MYSSTVVVQRRCILKIFLVWYMQVLCEHKSVIRWYRVRASLEFGLKMMFHCQLIFVADKLLGNVFSLTVMFQ